MSYDYEDVSKPLPKVRLETIGEAWTLFQQQVGVWLGAGALLFLAIFGVMGGGAFAMVLPFLGKKEPDPGVMIATLLGGYTVLIVVMMVLGGFLSAGMYRMAIRQVRGERIAISDLWSATDCVGPMIGASLLIGLAVSVGSQFFVIPGYILGGLWMLAAPLIADRKLGVIEAMTASWKALQPELVMAAVYYFVISLVASLGVLVLGIGAIATLPLFYLGLALVYRDFFPSEESHR